MTRSELVDLLAERSRQLTRRDAEAVVTIVLGAMGDALARGNRVEIRGFGSFAINRRPARIGHNPRTGQPIRIAELRVPHFKPGKELREAVAQQPERAERGRDQP